MRMSTARKFGTVSLFSLLLVLAFSLLSAASVLVSAVGVAALSSEVDPGRMRDEAIRDAWRRAAEQGAGVFLHAEARVEKLILVSSAVSTRVDAIIVDYDVVREWEDGVFYRVEILAEVDTFELGHVLEGLGFEIESIGNPRTVVRIQEERLGEPQTLSVAEALVRQALEERGFAVVEPNEASGCSFSALEATGPKAALELAQAFDADVSIVGTSAAEPLGSVQWGLFTWHNAIGLVDLQAYLRSTGDELGSVLAKAKAPEARMSMEAASIDAIEAAVSKALPKLLFEIIAKLNMVNGSGLRAVRLIIEGLGSFQDALHVESALGTLREAVSVNLLKYGETLTAYDVTYMGPTDALAAELESEDFAETLKAYSGKRMSLTVKAFDFVSIHAKLSR